MRWLQVLGMHQHLLGIRETCVKHMLDVHCTWCRVCTRHVLDILLEANLPNDVFSNSDRLSMIGFENDLQDGIALSRRQKFSLTGHGIAKRSNRPN